MFTGWLCWRHRTSLSTALLSTAQPFGAQTLQEYCTLHTAHFTLHTSQCTQHTRRAGRRCGCGTFTTLSLWPNGISRTIVEKLKLTLAEVCNCYLMLIWIKIILTIKQWKMVIHSLTLAAAFPAPLPWVRHLTIKFRSYCSQDPSPLLHHIQISQGER